LRFTGLPAFAPEILRRVMLKDTSKVKQLRRALEDLAEEGLVQVFRPQSGGNWIVGVIGVLQLEVLVSRARQEYKIGVRIEDLPYSSARWLRAEDPKVLDAFVKQNSFNIVEDSEGLPVYLAKSDWDLDYTERNNEDISFLKTRELQ